jgi:heptosyltransferase II
LFHILNWMYFTSMNIIIRLPNWLGDMVMSTAFVQAVREQYPVAAIDLIAKKGIDFLLDYFPPHNQRFVFSKEEYRGLAGTYAFGKKLRSQKKYDIFFCLPDSFSSALMAFASGAKTRVGYKKELRSVFLTHACQKKKGLHRVEEYIDLVNQYNKTSATSTSAILHTAAMQKNNSLVVNINSEASSRRLPKEKAVAIISALQNKIPADILLIGSPAEKSFVDEVYQALPSKENICNLAGTTNLPGLVQLLGGNAVMLTTDSGPAHVANALGTHTVVLFGAGNEHNTAPYNKTNCSIIRHGQLPCEPCVSNTCKIYGTPKCLMQLDERLIAQQVLDIFNHKKMIDALYR